MTLMFSKLQIRDNFQKISAFVEKSPFKGKIVIDYINKISNQSSNTYIPLKNSNSVVPEGAL